MCSFTSISSLIRMVCPQPTTSGRHAVRLELEFLEGRCVPSAVANPLTLSPGSLRTSTITSPAAGAMLGQGGLSAVAFDTAPQQPLPGSIGAKTSPILLVTLPVAPAPLAATPAVVVPSFVFNNLPTAAGFAPLSVPAANPTYPAARYIPMGVGEREPGMPTTIDANNFPWSMLYSANYGDTSGDTEMPAVDVASPSPDSEPHAQVHDQ
jgi:hypothetical protein